MLNKKNTREITFFNILIVFIISYVLSLLILFYFREFILNFSNIKEDISILSFLVLPIWNSINCIFTGILFLFNVTLYIFFILKSEEPGVSKNNRLGNEVENKWLTLKDFRKREDVDIGEAEKCTGFPIGMINKECISLNSKYRGNKNLEIVGGSGSGKSTSIIITNIHAAINKKASIVAVDTKGYLYSETFYLAQQQEYKIKVLNFINPTQSDGFNIFEIVQKDREKDEMIARMIYECLLEGKDGHAFFDTDAINLFRAFINYVLDEKDYLERLGKTESYSNPEYLGTFYRMMEIMLDFNIIDGALAQYDNLFMEMHEKFPEGKSFETYKLFRSNPEAKVLNDVVSTLTAHLSPLANTDIKVLLSRRDINFVELCEEPYIYYINLDELDNNCLMIATIFFSQFLDQVKNYIDAYYNGKSKQEIELILDEFGAIGKIASFPSFIAGSRSRNINTLIAYQSLVQLQKKYGEKDAITITSNCDSHLSVGINDYITAQNYERYFGYTTVKNEVISVEKNIEEISSYSHKLIPLYSFQEILNEEPEYITAHINRIGNIVLEKLKSYEYYTLSKYPKFNINEYKKDIENFDRLKKKTKEETIEIVKISRTKDEMIEAFKVLL